MDASSSAGFARALHIPRLPLHSAAVTTRAGIAQNSVKRCLGNPNMLHSPQLTCYSAAGAAVTTIVIISWTAPPKLPEFASLTPLHMEAVVTTAS
jgi:hypothetical protein